MGYRDKALAKKAGNAPAGNVINLLEKENRQEAALPDTSPGLLKDQRDDVIQIRRTNPQIYHRGRIFKVPIHLVGEHQLIMTNNTYTLYSTIDGEQSLHFPLPADWPPVPDWCPCGRCTARGSGIRDRPGRRRGSTTRTSTTPRRNRPKS